MSCSSKELSESVLRERALFASRNKETSEKPASVIGSRVSKSEAVNLAASVSDIDEDRDQQGNQARGRKRRRHRSRFESSSHSRSKSRSPSRSLRSKSRSVSRLSSRSRSPNQQGPSTLTAKFYKISRSKFLEVRKWVVQGLSKNESKSTRENYKEVFDGHFSLAVPKLDESMQRHWLRVKGMPKFNY